jgi:ribonucleoside-diphosphate reductase alpha chain
MVLTDLGQRIFLDRYAQKDPNAAQNLRVSDTVLVVDGSKRLKGTVILVGKDATVELDDGTQRNVPLNLIELPIETLEDMHARVAAGIASVEADSTLWTGNFKWLLKDNKFVPAGRIQASAGTPYKLTSFNCFVIPSPHDSRGGIVKTLGEMTEIMSRGGGVGINFSSLRPKHALVRGVNGRSSGPIPFIDIYSRMTGTIEQAGSRRGALMAMLNDWHPDIFSFISAKTAPDYMTNCNISVCFSDAFMEQLAADGDWTLCFPDTTHPDYDTAWTGDIVAWQAAGYPIVVYKTIKARELWDAVIASAHASAEPGVFFLDRANKMSNSHYYAPIIATNPCGEEPLPAWGVCNLGALNLAQFVTNGRVDWSSFMIAISYAVRFLDDVIDWTPYFYDVNREQQMSERRVGLGVMGLAEMLIKLKIRYGSDQGVKFVDELFSFLSYHAYAASIKLAQEKGAFPCFDAEQFLNSGYMQTMPKDIRRHVREFGIRNVTLLTIAPTGTTSTMLNTSGGVEPFFSLKWYRTSRLGTHEENLPLAQEWLDANPGSSLPHYFVTAMELSPEEQVKMQAAAQRWIDAAISKTVNVPGNYTIEQTARLYELMYELGCKGGTIYRDGSRTEQVLNLEKPKESGHAAPICDDCKIPMVAYEGCWKCPCGNELCQS